MFGILWGEKRGAPIDPESSEFQEKWFEMSRGVLFYGSPSVLNAFAEFKGGAMDQSNADPRVVMKRVGRILLAMRADIGLSNFGLNEVNIHQIYVNDDINKLGQIS